MSEVLTCEGWKAMETGEARKYLVKVHSWGDHMTLEKGKNAFLTMAYTAEDALTQVRVHFGPEYSESSRTTLYEVLEVMPCDANCPTIEDIRNFGNMFLVTVQNIVTTGESPYFAEERVKELLR